MPDNAQLNDLVNQAIGAFNRGNYREAAGFADQALALDFANPQIWVLLHRMTDSKKSVAEFQHDFTLKYYPHQLANLEVQKAGGLLYPPFSAAYQAPIYPYPMELVVTEYAATMNLAGKRETQFQLNSREKKGQYSGELMDVRKQLLGRVEGTIEYEKLGGLMSLVGKKIKSVELRLTDTRNSLLGFVVAQPGEILWTVLDAERRHFAKLEQYPIGNRCQMIGNMNVGLTVQSTQRIERGTTALYFRLDQFGNTGLLSPQIQQLMFFGFLVQLTNYAAYQITFAMA